MPPRSPARFFAPLVLAAALLTVYLVARPELGSSPDPRVTTSTSTSSRPTKQVKTAPSQAKQAGSSTATKPATTGASGATGADGGSYTVQPGDVLGSISEMTGVSVADLMAFNDIDAHKLRVGQQLKLSP